MFRLKNRLQGHYASRKFVFSAEHILTLSLHSEVLMFDIGAGFMGKRQPAPFCTHQIKKNFNFFYQPRL